MEEKAVEQSFNSFFTFVASSLVDKLPSCTKQYNSQVVDDYYEKLGVTKGWFKLNTVSEGVVL